MLSSTVYSIAQSYNLLSGGCNDDVEKGWERRKSHIKLVVPLSLCLKQNPAGRADDGRELHRNKQKSLIVPGVPMGVRGQSAIPAPTLSQVC